MPKSCSVFFGVMSLLIAAPALAIPIIDKSQAAADARTDPGSGVCGSITHFTAGMPIGSKSAAEAILNKPATDPAILGRTARLFDNLNFRNGQPNTSGDFTAPSSPDAVFPYSLDAQATPMGTDANFTMRLRGYFNVPPALAAKTISFGLNCDDFCSLRIGTTDLAQANELTSSRIIKQVNFKDAGLYPIELVYYQNGSTAYLEWSRSDSAVPECASSVCTVSLTDPSYAGAFKPVATTELFSARIGTNPGCQECGAPGMDCSTGNFCGDGLCQTCNLPDHCGPACVVCPASASVCSNAKCVQCTADDQCPNGQTCDVPNGKCVPPQPCTRTDQCPRGQICDLSTNLCGGDDLPCTSDAMCPFGEVCITTGGLNACHTKPIMCNADADCKAGLYCDLAVHFCTSTPVPPVVTGCTAAWGTDNGPGPKAGGLASLVLFCGAAALLLFRRSPRRNVDQKRA